MSSMEYDAEVVRQPWLYLDADIEVGDAISEE